MSTITLACPDGIPVGEKAQIGRILLLAALLLIAASILVIVVLTSAHLNGLPVSISAIPVPTPPIAEFQSSPYATPAPSAGSQPSVVAVPVPTPPSP